MSKPSKNTLFAASLIGFVMIFNPSIVSGEETIIKSISSLKDNDIKAGFWCRFLGTCANNGPRGGGYCPIAPNNKSVSIWRQRPVFSFFDVEGTVEKIELYDLGEAEPIWDYPIDNQTAQTLHVIVHSDDFAIAVGDVRNLSSYGGESFQVRFHQSSNLPELESGMWYDYAIRTTDSDKTADTHERLLLESVSNERIVSQISEDVEELQQNHTGDELNQLLFSYFSEPFNSNRTEFQFLPSSEDIFLLDAFFHLLSLPPTEQTVHFQDIYQAINETCLVEETQTGQ
ncbi:MAG: hypothetical protein AAF959_13610 [Cyanobacteria bacterium P01_D01_bin.56]